MYYGLLHHPLVWMDHLRIRSTSTLLFVKEWLKYSNIIWPQLNRPFILWDWKGVMVCRYTISIIDMTPTFSLPAPVLKHTGWFHVPTCMKVGVAMDIGLWIQVEAVRTSVPHSRALSLLRSLGNMFWQHFPTTKAPSITKWIQGPAVKNRLWLGYSLRFRSCLL